VAWINLFGLGLLLWGACGAVMAAGRRLWSLSTALRVHLVAAPAAAFLVSAIHKLLYPEFNLVLRAAIMTGLVFTLDLLIVAPIFERSYEMFRSLIGTWIPFALIFIASLSAGVLLSH
jgi:Na+-transporting NADH:ubiquinone oxidoreductase subunit NqrD